MAERAFRSRRRNRGRPACQVAGHGEQGWGLRRGGRGLIYSAFDSDESAPEKTLADARETAIRLLARREHARRELHFKLGGRGFPAELIETALDELEQEGLQSDTRFAESYARQRCERGYGPHRLRAELKERGVDEWRIDSALAELDVDWFERASAVRDKRFGEEPPADFRAAAKQRKFLEYRGFPSDIVREVVPG